MTASQTIIPQETIWGSRLHPTGDSLWIKGYRCLIADGSLFVVKPDNKTRYLLNPFEDTCSCPARVRCKHKDGLTSLVFLSMSEYAFYGLFDEYDALCGYWFAYCRFLGRTR